MKRILCILIIIVLVGCNNSELQKQSKDIRGFFVEEKVIGTYSTKLTDKKEGRVHNIKLGVSLLNETKVEPGATFSFNEVIGERTPERGFEKAIIFDGKGNKEQGYGGGLCQISTTLYNAVVMAGLSVEERHEHSRDVPYIEDGLDATVSYYDNEDFKFKNTSKNAITIYAEATDDMISVTIKG